MQRISRWAPWVSLLAECVLLSQAVTAEGRTRAPEHSLPAVSATALGRAHSHNDYDHARPLLDALEHGFTSIEADVWLVNGRLMLGHAFFQVNPELSLEDDYLAPLARHVASNGGRVYADWSRPVQLLLDIKSDGEATYRAIHALLARYSPMLTRFEGDRVEPGAVTVVISGNRPRGLMQAQALRYAGYDGRLSQAAEPASLAPLVSDQWSALFSWNGVGPMPEHERTALHEHVRRAHARGQRVRFWGTPDHAPEREAVWRELLVAGVDHFNTDDLPGLRAWLEENDPEAGQRIAQRMSSDDGFERALPSPAAASTVPLMLKAGAF